MSQFVIFQSAIDYPSIQLDSSLPSSLECIRIQPIFLLRTDVPIENWPTLAYEKLCVITELKQSKEIAQLKSKPESLFVLPRQHTRSAWSTKALSLFKRINLPVCYLEMGHVYSFSDAITPHQALLEASLVDRMTETSLTDPSLLRHWFDQASPQSLQILDIQAGGLEALKAYNQTHSLALNDAEMDYLIQTFQAIGRNPTDVELMMFAQANSEHCRHKIFNAHWQKDQTVQPYSPFDFIRQTHQQSPEGTLSAYEDNAAVIENFGQKQWRNDENGVYMSQAIKMAMLIKVETHNHPTAISPYSGASTGVGGEIRDEIATGRGARSIAGLSGFLVSDLHLPHLKQPWETFDHRPNSIASASQIMHQAPLGAANFGNEFGRPNLTGFFRTLTQKDPVSDIQWGYHKPIMLAGGMGQIRANHVQKGKINPGDHLVVIGGAALLIGLGGGSASSQDDQDTEQLDFASVQRDNPEMQRRAAEVILRASQLDSNPIAFIHDVGAGGLSNALPELINDGGVGGDFQLRDIQIDDQSLSPMEIWCNESQERFVLAIAPENWERFEALCQRERCPYAIVGTATQTPHLSLYDSLFDEKSIELPLSVLFAKTPRALKSLIEPSASSYPSEEIVLKTLADSSLESLALSVLNLPSVASKSFLITIADRTVGGLTVRDQMVGNWQVPTADLAITQDHYDEISGQAMAIGEKCALAPFSPEASGRMAVAESITNLMAAYINPKSIKLSANWMADAGMDSQAHALYQTVQSVSQFCQAIGVAIPVGKDSLSMKMKWKDDSKDYQVTSPVSLIVSAFAPLEDVRQACTPLFNQEDPSTLLLLIDCGLGQKRMGGSALWQTQNLATAITPDIAPETLSALMKSMNDCHEQALIEAYHDRSDGGLVTTLLEMAFTNQTGLYIELDSYCQSEDQLIGALFNEEVGAVLEIKTHQLQAVQAIFKAHGLGEHCHLIGQKCNETPQLSFFFKKQACLTLDLFQAHQAWSSTSEAIAQSRDNTAIVSEALEILGEPRSGLYENTTFALTPFISNTKPRVAILRDHGTNGHQEMAYAFSQAGFEAIDLSMTDLLDHGKDLSSFKGLAVCGGFSYGDVFGAGKGWAMSILYNDKLRDQFETFFHRSDTFTLGTCNGCQVLPYLKSLIPGAAHFSPILPNQSARFEARLVEVAITNSDSLFFNNMKDTHLPIVVSHGEGQIQNPEGILNPHVNLCYLDPQTSLPTMRYPYNPNGSADSIAGFHSEDGRVCLMMPHPERTLHVINETWRNAQSIREKGTHPSAWMQLFYNARQWVN